MAVVALRIWWAGEEGGDEWQVASEAAAERCVKYCTKAKRNSKAYIYIWRYFEDDDAEFDSYL